MASLYQRISEWRKHPLTHRPRPLRPRPRSAEQTTQERDEVAVRRMPSLDPLEAIDSLLASLGQLQDEQELSAKLLQMATRVLGANAGLLWLLDEAKQQLNLVHAVGYPREVSSSWHSVPLSSPVPMTEALQHEAPVVLTSLLERSQRYPQLSSLRAATGNGAFVAQRLPLGLVPGVLVLNFPWNRALSHHEQRILHLLASECASGLARVRASAKSTAETPDEHALEALRKLAAGVAHDLNNLLTIVVSAADLILLSSASTPKVTRRANEIIAAAQRATTLANQLVGMSRPLGPHESSSDLNRVVEGALASLHRMLPSRTQVIPALAPNAGFVRGEATQLEQVVASLVLSVKDAWRESCTIRLGTRVVELSAEDVRETGVLKPGRYGVVTISDARTGNGDGNGSRRVPGRGERPSGQGLAAAFGIVEQYGGEIDIQTTGGNRMLFSVYLPAADEPEKGSEKRPPPSLKASTILLVEDEEMVRQLTAMMLRDLGYRVLEAAEGHSALTLLKQLSEPVDLLLTDVMMPGMSGGQLAQAVRAISRDVKVLYMSGHNEDVLAREGIARREVRLLPKPFTQAVLARTVREVLDEAAPVAHA